MGVGVGVVDRGMEEGLGCYQAHESHRWRAS